MTEFTNGDRVRILPGNEFLDSIGAADKVGTVEVVDDLTNALLDMLTGEKPQRYAVWLDDGALPDWAAVPVYAGEVERV